MDFVNGIVWFLLELADAAWALITTVMGDLYRWPKETLLFLVLSSGKSLTEV
jgi:hypothetical protein